LRAFEVSEPLPALHALWCTGDLPPATNKQQTSAAASAPLTPALPATLYAQFFDTALFAQRMAVRCAQTHPDPTSLEAAEAAAQRSAQRLEQVRAWPTLESAAASTSASASAQPQHSARYWHEQWVQAMALQHYEVAVEWLRAARALRSAPTSASTTASASAQSCLFTADYVHHLIQALGTEIERAARTLEQLSTQHLRSIQPKLHALRQLWTQHHPNASAAAQQKVWGSGSAADVVAPQPLPSTANALERDIYSTRYQWYVLQRTQRTAALRQTKRIQCLRSVLLLTANVDIATSPFAAASGSASASPSTSASTTASASASASAASAAVGLRLHKRSYTLALRALVTARDMSSAWHLWDHIIALHTATTPSSPNASAGGGGGGGSGLVDRVMCGVALSAAAAEGNVPRAIAVYALMKQHHISPDCLIFNLVMHTPLSLRRPPLSAFVTSLM
jgi:hypothetical protein